MVVVAVAVVGKPMGNTHQPTHIPIPTWVGTDPWWVWVWVGLRVPMGIPTLFPKLGMLFHGFGFLTDIAVLSWQPPTSANWNSDWESWES